MEREERIKAFRRLATDLDGVDLPVYTQYDRDPLEPILGGGASHCRLAVFGRDPGRDEVKHLTPFIGAGGQKVRAVLHQVLYGREMPDFQASMAVGQFLFWANTAPYKPLGNKAWSAAVKKRFQPLIADLLIHGWSGSDVITLGREAFLWFGIGQDRESRRALDDYWKRQDRFESSHTLTLTAPDGAARQLRLHPLPHPSPLNAVWFKRFPDLLHARLTSLDLTPAHWRLD